MSPYIIVGIVISILSVLGFGKKYGHAAYMISLVVLTLFLVLRYGQGTDWLSYNYIYTMSPGDFDFGGVFYSNAIHSEFGWKLINNIFKVLNIPFTVMCVMLSIFEMYCLHRYIVRRSDNGALSLLLAYPVLILTTYFSTFRQGLVTAIFLGYLLEMLEKEHVIRYCVVTLLLCTLHSMSIVLLLPIVFRKIDVEYMGTLLLLCAIVGILSIALLPWLIRLVGLNYSSGGVSAAALLYRCVIAALVYLLWMQAKRNHANLDSCIPLVKIYICGLCVYLAFMGNDLYASRLASILLALDIVLIPILYNRAQSSSSILVLLIIFTACSVMTIKNLDTYVEQGYYRQDITALNYPYISIFDKELLFEYTTNPLLQFISL